MRTPTRPKTTSIRATRAPLLATLLAAWALAAPFAAAQAPQPVYREIYSLPGFPSSANCAFWDAKSDGALDLLLATADYEYVIANEQPIGPDFAYQERATRPLAGPTSTNTWHSMEVADFNGDGAPDILLDSNADSLSAPTAYIRFNQLGGLWTTSNVVTFSNPKTRDWSAFDFDGDGDVDLAGATSATISFFANDGGTTPVFAPVMLSATTGAWRVEAGDLDNDGDQDIVALTTTGVRWFSNLGGTPVQFTLMPAADFAFSPRDASKGALAVGDFNGDGATDVAVGDSLKDANGLERIWVSYGTPGPVYAFSEPILAFAPPTPTIYFTGASRLRLKGVDLNGDGRDELLAARSRGSFVGEFHEMPGAAYLWLGSDGTWSQKPISEETWSASGADAADLDGDGLLEVFAAGAGRARVFGASLSDERLEIVDSWAVDASGDGAVSPGEPGELRVAVRRRGGSAFDEGEFTVSIAPSSHFLFEETSRTFPIPNSPGVVVASFPFLSTYATEDPVSVAYCEALERARAPVSIELEWPGGFQRGAFTGRFGKFYSQFQFQENATEEPLPDGTGQVVERVFNFAFPPISRRLDAFLSIDISHTHRGDLEVLARPPDGGSHTIYRGALNDSQDDLVQQFSVFNAAFPPDGEYRVTVEDRAFGETGQLNYASLAFVALVYVCDAWNGASFPTLDFAPETLPATGGGWTFAAGDGNFSAPAAGRSSNGFEIEFDAASPMALLGDETGGWSNPGFNGLDLQAGRLHAARAWLSASQAADSASSARLRAQAVASSVDHVYNINDNQGGPHGLPVGELKAYTAYFRPLDLDVLGQHIFAFDGSDNGLAIGANRTIALRGLEFASEDANALLGSGNTLLSAGQGGFGAWSYVNYGPYSLEGGIPFIEGGAGASNGGFLQHFDDAEGGELSGGAAEWLYSPGDQMQAAPGALFRAAWTIAADDGPADDGGFARSRMAARSTQAALSIENVLRGDGPALDAAAASPAGTATVEQWWTGHASSAALNGAVADDLIAAFGLFNFANGDPARDGALELRSILIEELAADDPNTP
jgi:hypothetical protein